MGKYRTEHLRTHVHKHTHIYTHIHAQTPYIEMNTRRRTLTYSSQTHVLVSPVYVACPLGSRRGGGKRQYDLTVGPMSAALRRIGLGRPIGRVAKTARPKTPG